MLTDPDDSFSAGLSLDCCSFFLAIFLMNDIFSLNISLKVILRRNECKHWKMLHVLLIMYNYCIITSCMNKQQFSVRTKISLTDVITE